MMRALLVVAHPCQESYCQQIAARAAAGLRRAGHDVDVIDLYEVGYRAAMTLEERRDYEGDDPIKDPMVAEHVALLRAAEILVFVYPTWWSGLPAILKGWFERTMVPGVGFILDPRTNKVKPGLRQVRKIIGINTWGSPRPYALLVNDNGRRVVSRALRMSCGFRVRTKWLALYGLDRSGPERRAAFLDEVEKKMARV